MTKNLLKLLATVTVAGLLVGCGSSSSDGETNTTTPPVVDSDTPTTPVEETTYTSNISFVDGKFTTTDGKELTLSNLTIADDNTTLVGSDANYSISSLYYANGVVSVISEANASMITSVDSNVTEVTTPAEDNTTTPVVPVTDGNKILPF